MQMLCTKHDLTGDPSLIHDLLLALLTKRMDAFISDAFPTIWGALSCDFAPPAPLVPPAAPNHLPTMVWEICWDGFFTGSSAELVSPSHMLVAQP